LFRGRIPPANGFCHFKCIFTRQGRDGVPQPLFARSVCPVQGAVEINMMLPLRAIAKALLDLRLSLNLLIDKEFQLLFACGVLDG